MRDRTPISRAVYDALAGSSLTSPAWHKPEVRPLRLSGLDLLVKDYRRCHALVRETWGRLMVSREDSIYRTLKGLEGIPRYFGRIDAFAFIVERIDGEEVRGLAPGELGPEFFVRLRGIVDGMHARGVFHGDLRQRRNILRSATGEPCLIDFASALRLPRGSALLGLLAKIDLSGVAKLKRKHLPGELTAEDRALLRQESWRPLKRARLNRRAER